MTAQQPKGLNVGDKAILASALFWGTGWYPVRELNDAAASAGSFPMFVSYAIAGFVTLPFVFIHFTDIRGAFVKWLGIGVFAASAYTLYVEALLIGQIGRVLILFYLMPVWATLLERFVLGQKLTLDRVITLVVGFCGLVFIAGPEALAGTFSAVDIMSVAAGLSFAIAVFLINRTPEIPVSGKIGGIFMMSVPIFFVVSLLPGGSEAIQLAAVPSDAWLWILVHALIWFVPAFGLSIYGSNLTQPGRAAIFFMAEVLTGIITAALFAGEVLTGREAIGAVLVVSAGLIEGIGLDVLLRRKRP